MIAECIAFVNEVWNPYGSQDVELVGGVGAMRDKKGVIMAESLIKTDHWEFKIGFRPPIWCTVDEDNNITLSKYPASYKSAEDQFSAPPIKEED